MIEEVVTPEGVEAFWSDCQDGEGETFTLPAGDTNYTDVIPSATDSSGGADALPALVSALARVTGERDRARGLAARLEEQLARVDSRLSRIEDGLSLLASDLRKTGPLVSAAVVRTVALRVESLLSGDGA